MKKETAELLRQLGTLGLLGTTLAMAIVIGTGIGYYLDKWLNTSPYLTIVFFSFGVFAGYLNVFREIKRLKVD